MAGKKTPAWLGVPGNPKHPPLLHSCLAFGALQSPELTPHLAALPAHIPKIRQDHSQRCRALSLSPFHLVSLLGFGWLGPALISATLEHMLVLKGVSFIPFPS